MSTVKCDLNVYVLFHVHSQTSCRIPWAFSHDWHTEPNILVCGTGRREGTKIPSDSLTLSGCLIKLIIIYIRLDSQRVHYNHRGNIPVIEHLGNLILPSYCAFAYPYFWRDENEPIYVHYYKRSIYEGTTIKKDTEFLQNGKPKLYQS